MRNTQAVWLRMAFHILEPVKQGDSTVLQWEESYQEGGGDITYSVELSKDYTFSDCMVSEQTGETRVDAGSLSPGQYFVRVRATGSNDVSQDAYEYYQTEAGSKAYSTLCFTYSRTQYFCRQLQRGLMNDGRIENETAGLPE